MGSDRQKGPAKIAIWEPRGRGRRGLYSGLQAGQQKNMFSPLRLQSSNTPFLPATPHLVFPAAIYYPEGSQSGLQKSQMRPGHSLLLKSLPWLPITSGIESKLCSVLCNLSCCFPSIWGSGACSLGFLEWTTHGRACLHIVIASVKATPLFPPQGTYNTSLMDNSVSHEASDPKNPRVYA